MGIHSVIPYNPKINNSAVTAKVTVAGIAAVQTTLSYNSINDAGSIAASFFCHTPQLPFHNHKNLL
jgi:hypothetical protein